MRDYDIKSDLKQEQFQTLKLVQGDRGNKIKINVFEEGQPVDLAGCSITAKYKSAFKNYISNGGVLMNCLKFYNDDANIRSSTYWNILNS